MHDLQRKRHQQIGPARGSRRRFCCKSCRLTYWILKKAAKLLAPLEQVRSWEILLKLSREGQIANSRALSYGPDQSQTAKSSENGENYQRDDICPRTPKRALFPEQDRIQTKEKNVVKPPRMPVVRNRRQVCPGSLLCVNHPISTPMTNEPDMLTASVSIGKPKPSSRRAATLTPWRRAPPSPAPKKTMR